jgi:nitroimidazol reductase NimA-like FMN-containing flavoprotein (pyridoxamine 5'-phosphate oxidase superfamily)
MSSAPDNWSEAAAILDQGWIFHLGVSGPDGLAASIPLLYVRHDTSLLLHGGVANATLKDLVARGRASGNVTLVDGLIVARSAHQSSVAYRSVHVTGKIALVDGDDKPTALERVTEGLLAGRVAEIRPMTSGEMRGTLLVRLDIESAVVRTSSPVVDDTPSDRGGPQWAGVVPIEVSAGPPIAASDVSGDTPIPPSVRGWTPPRG